MNAKNKTSRTPGISWGVSIRYENDGAAFIKVYTNKQSEPVAEMPAPVAAAAPDLLAAALAVVAHADPKNACAGDHPIARLRAAIAKASGEGA